MIRLSSASISFSNIGTTHVHNTPTQHTHKPLTSEGGWNAGNEESRGGFFGRLLFNGVLLLPLFVEKSSNEAVVLRSSRIFEGLKGLQRRGRLMVVD